MTFIIFLAFGFDSKYNPSYKWGHVFILNSKYIAKTHNGNNEMKQSCKPRPICLPRPAWPWWTTAWLPVGTITDQVVWPTSMIVASHLLMVSHSITYTHGHCLQALFSVTSVPSQLRSLMHVCLLWCACAFSDVCVSFLMCVCAFSAALSNALEPSPMHVCHLYCLPLYHQISQGRRSIACWWDNYNHACCTL